MQDKSGSDSLRADKKRLFLAAQLWTAANLPCAHFLEPRELSLDHICIDHEVSIDE